MMILIIMLSTISYITCNSCNISSSTKIVPIGWYMDNSLQSHENVGCDLPVLHADELESLSTIPTKEYPFIIRGLIDHWPAHEKWKKDNFLDLYGDRVVRTGSESSIVHSGGRADEYTLLKDMISSKMQTHNSNDSIEKDRYGDSFVFDTTILKEIPELINDIDIPAMFQDWDNEEQESNGEMWHMLSLGPSKSGLPFHNHGQTWLAVVHGRKKWFLYPPGFDPPIEVDAHFNPMLSVSDWIRNVYDNIKWAPKPPRKYLHYSKDNNRYEIYDEDNSYNTNYGFRPLECVQEPGDVLYLPTRWTHLTLNIGETIAIGGQQTLYDRERFDQAVSILEKFPNNYDAWKDLGLAQSNQAAQLLSKIRENYNDIMNDQGLITIPPNTNIITIDNAMQESMDTWVVLYYSSCNQTHSRDIIPKLIQDFGFLAQDTYGEVDVAIYDICNLVHKYNISSNSLLGNKITKTIANAPNRTPYFQHSISITNTISDYIIINAMDDRHYFSTLPMIKIHRGLSNDNSIDTFTVDCEGVEYPGKFGDVSTLLEYIREYVRNNNLVRGSISRVPASVKQRNKIAMESMIRALDIKPLQPELIAMIGEVAGLAHEFDAMHQVIHIGELILDAADTTTMSPLSIASGYLKLAQSYIAINMTTDAMFLLLKSIKSMPDYVPAITELIHTYIKLGNTSEAYTLLETLERIANNTNSNSENIEIYREIEEFRTAINEL